ncbi:MAG TPA: hypothetical protein VHC18_09555 [Amycolatopsis sp.]|nr:hypothetical protein [Amycolatopsis sp.]
MSWQDELRRLDAELAKGTISLHDHRKLREELLAAAAGRFEPAARRRGKSAEWPAALLESERSTTAPSPADERATEQMPYPPISEAPTVVTRPVGPLPALTPPPDKAHRVPPLPTVPVRQSSQKRTWLFVTASVVLTLVLIIVASVILLNRDKPAPATALPAPTTGSSVPSVPLAQRLPTLPGTANADSGTVPVGDGPRRGLYPADAAQEFTQSGAGTVEYRASSAGTELYFLLAIQTGTADQARAVADFMRDGALKSGFTPLPDDVSIVTGVQNGRTMNGTWYSSDNVAIVLWVAQPVKTHKDAQLKQSLDQTRSVLQQALPAR